MCNYKCNTLYRMVYHIRCMYVCTCLSKLQLMHAWSMSYTCKWTCSMCMCWRLIILCCGCYSVGAIAGIVIGVAFAVIIVAVIIVVLIIVYFRVRKEVRASVYVVCKCVCGGQVCTYKCVTGVQVCMWWASVYVHLVHRRDQNLLLLYLFTHWHFSYNMLLACSVYILSTCTIFCHFAWELVP